MCDICYPARSPMGSGTTTTLRAEYLKRLRTYDPGPELLHAIDEVAAEFGIHLDEELDVD